MKTANRPPTVNLTLPVATATAPGGGAPHVRRAQGGPPLT